MNQTKLLFFFLGMFFGEIVGLLIPNYKQSNSTLIFSVFFFYVCFALIKEIQKKVQEKFGDKYDVLLWIVGLIASLVVFDRIITLFF